MDIQSVLLYNKSQTVKKYIILRCWRILLKILDPEPDYFKNLITYSLSTDTSLVKFLRRSISSFTRSC